MHFVSLLDSRVSSQIQPSMRSTHQQVFLAKLTTHSFALQNPWIDKRLNSNRSGLYDVVMVPLNVYSPWALAALRTPSLPLTNLFFFRLTEQRRTKKTAQNLFIFTHVARCLSGRRAANIQIFSFRSHRPWWLSYLSCCLRRACCSRGIEARDGRVDFNKVTSRLGQTQIRSSKGPSNKWYVFKCLFGA